MKRQLVWRGVSEWRLMNYGVRRGRLPNLVGDWVNGSSKVGFPAETDEISTNKNKSIRRPAK
jgi:hypothetical protein